MPGLSQSPDNTRDAVAPLLSKRKVAVYLGISERTVDRLVLSGDLFAYRVGGHRRFRIAEVHAFVDGRREHAR
jgi:excisionase family DNA binding protein